MRLPATRLNTWRMQEVKIVANTFRKNSVEYNIRVTTIKFTSINKM